MSPRFSTNFPRGDFRSQRIEAAAKALRRYPREEAKAVALRFAEDFMRLRRDLRNYERLDRGHGARPTGPQRAHPRDLPHEQQPLRILAALGSAPGAGQRGQPRRGQSRRARLDQDHARPAGARAQSRHALQPEFLRAGRSASSTAMAPPRCSSKAMPWSWLSSRRSRTARISAPSPRLARWRARFWPSPPPTTTAPKTTPTCPALGTGRRRRFPGFRADLLGGSAIRAS